MTAGGGQEALKLCLMLSGLTDGIDHAHRARQVKRNSISYIAIEFVSHQLGPESLTNLGNPFSPLIYRYLHPQSLFLQRLKIFDYLRYTNHPIVLLSNLTASCRKNPMEVR